MVALEPTTNRRRNIKQHLQPKTVIGVLKWDETDLIDLKYLTTQKGIHWSERIIKVEQ